MTQTDTQTLGNTQADTYKPTQRYIKACIFSQRHTSTHRDTYKHTYKHIYKQTHKQIDIQTTNGFIIPRPSDQGSDQGPKGSREVCTTGRGLHPLPSKAWSMVRGLYNVVNRGSGRISPA